MAAELILVSRTVNRLADILDAKEEQCQEITANLMAVMTKAEITPMPVSDLQSLDHVQQCLSDIARFLRGLAEYAITADLSEDQLELVISKIMLHDLKSMLRGEHWAVDEISNLHERHEGDILLF